MKNYEITFLVPGNLSAEESYFLANKGNFAFAQVQAYN